MQGAVGGRCYLKALRLDKEDGLAEMSPCGGAGDALAGVLVALEGFLLGGFYDSDHRNRVLPAELVDSTDECLDLMALGRRVYEAPEGFPDSQGGSGREYLVHDLVDTHLLVPCLDGSDTARLDPHAREGTADGCDAAIGGHIDPRNGMGCKAQEWLSLFPFEDIVQEPAGFASAGRAAKQVNFVRRKYQIDQEFMCQIVFPLTESRAGWVKHPTLGWRQGCWGSAA